MFKIHRSVTGINAFWLAVVSASLLSVARAAADEPIAAEKQTTFYVVTKGAMILFDEKPDSANYAEHFERRDQSNWPLAMGCGFDIEEQSYKRDDNGILSFDVITDGQKSYSFFAVLSEDGEFNPKEDLQDVEEKRLRKKGWQFLKSFIQSLKFKAAVSFQQLANQVRSKQQETAQTTPDEISSEEVSEEAELGKQSGVWSEPQKDDSSSHSSKNSEQDQDATPKEIVFDECQKAPKAESSSSSSSEGIRGIWPEDQDEEASPEDIPFHSRRRLANKLSAYEKQLQ